MARDASTAVGLTSLVSALSLTELLVADVEPQLALVLRYSAELAVDPTTSQRTAELSLGMLPLQQLLEGRRSAIDAVSPATSAANAPNSLTPRSLMASLPLYPLTRSRPQLSPFSVRSPPMSPRVACSFVGMVPIVSFRRG